MSHVSLAELFTSQRGSAVPVARRGATQIGWRQFAADVAATRDAVASRSPAVAAVLGDDAYGFAVGMLGVLHAGARALVPPNPLPDTIASVAGHVDLLVADRPVGPDVPFVPVVRGSTWNRAPGALDAARATVEFFTSGSTGTPKRIAKPLREIDRDLMLFDRTWGAALTGRMTYSTVPFLHFFGMTFHVLWPLAAGRPFSIEIDEYWETLLAQSTGGAILITSPGHLLRLTGLPPLPPERRFAHIYEGGAPLPLAAVAETRSILGVMPNEMLGSTETGPMGTRQQHEENEPWQPIRGVHIARNAEGCAVVSWPDDPDTPPFESADRIEMLPDGRFHLLGRADLIVKIEGKRVSLPEVEAALQCVDLVAEAAAVDLDGIPARLAAAVVLSDAGRQKLAEIGSFRLGRLLRRQLSATLEAAAQPKRWRFVPELPKRALGKRDTAALRSLFARADGEPP